VTGAFAAVYRTGRAAAAGYGRHACSQLAAAIAYRVLFALVPFLALVLSILELVLPQEARSNVMEWLFHGAPGNDLESAVEKTVVHPGASISIGGLVALAILLWSATGMTSAIRVSLGIVFEVDRPRYARAKLRDFGLIALISLLLLGGFAISVGVRVVAEVGQNLSDTVGLGDDWHVAGTALQVGGSIAVAFAAFWLLYALATPVDLGFTHLWPSALLAAAAVEALATGFAFYLGHFSDFSAVYGSLGAVFALLLLVYLVGAILLFGAEIAAARLAEG